MRMIVAYMLLLLLATSVLAGHKSEFYRKFEKDYGAIDLDLLNNPGETAEIRGFVYRKDVATFTFTEGSIHLLRYLDGRPTTAIFVGKGNATIRIPSHAEVEGLCCAVNDRVVSDDGILSVDFDGCFIRLADDFDLKLKEEFSFKKQELNWKNFTIAKQDQGETYFKPVRWDTYDNYFQLLRSHYERSEDGFFWIDFGRYVFTFDPNQPEEVRIAYEFEAADEVLTEGATFQRKERNIYDDSAISNIAYQITTIEKHGDLEMGGPDGGQIKSARANIKVVVNADSLRYLTLFLHDNLKTDSIYFEGQPVDYHRRRDFQAMGIMLPEYRYQNDTIDLSFFYKGKDFDYTLPYTADPTPSIHSFTFVVPKGYNYLMPSMGPREKVELSREQFEVIPPQPFRRFYVQGYVSGFDTITTVSDIGMSLNFLKSKQIKKSNYDCFLPDKLYRRAITDAFNYYCAKLGAPIGAFGMYIYPKGFMSMPGIIEVPQVACVTEGTMEAVGGLDAIAGHSVARQWFGALMRPATYREAWLSEAIPQYLSLLFVQDNVGAGEFYSNLAIRRDTIASTYDRGRGILPLAAGARADDSYSANFGVWVMHMLRILMLDLETQSDNEFMRFQRELVLTFNNRKFTNHDFVRLAEKHYGHSLDFFFDQWLYGRAYPDYKVRYSIDQKADGYYIVGTVETKRVTANFDMPVLLRIELSDGQSRFVRESIHAGHDEFRIGPFETKPKELHFNEYLSVLSTDHVKKR
ncbi:MAG: hypothetical protein ACE5FH_01390 [Candidatus Zixiibacteriota bacterium]